MPYRNALPPTAEELHVDLVLSRLLRRLFRTRTIEQIVYGKRELVSICMLVSMDPSPILSHHNTSYAMLVWSLLDAMLFPSHQEVLEVKEEHDDTSGFIPPLHMKTGFDVVVHRSTSPPPSLPPAPAVPHDSGDLETSSSSGNFHR